jgi:methylated-DNA-[protein]-cysteine S-methyltransferase
MKHSQSTITTMKIYFGELNHTPYGDLCYAASNQGLVAIEWAESRPKLEAYLLKFKAAVEPNQKTTRTYRNELAEYLNGKRRGFTFLIDWSTLKPFQQKVLKAVYAIPYGETRTYAEVAMLIGHPNASRAVGHANATNPMPLVIPCHRVIGKDGKLRGYGGGDGLPTKERLLRMEGVAIA